MRRTLAALTTSAVLIPLAITAMPGAALAATNALTVHVYGRDGAKVSTSVHATNLNTREAYTLTSNRARKLPRGTYVVAAEIVGSDDTTVLGGRTVKVSGSSSTVIDGRKGKPFQVSLNPPTAETLGALTARICAGSDYLVESHAILDKLYVIPNGSENFRLAYAADWMDTHQSGTSTEVRGRYAALGSMIGLPNNFRRTVQRSSLVPVTLHARSQARGDQQHLGVALHSRAGGCAGGLSVTGHGGYGGFTMPLHLSPGKYRFVAETPLHISVRDRTFASGGRYSQNFFNAGRGPGYDLPYTYGRSLYFNPHGMFTDTGSTGVVETFTDGYSSTEGVKTSTTLTKGGRTLKKETKRFTYAHEARFNYLMTSAGWYGLTVSAKREHPTMAMPSGLLSYRTTARFRFHADPRKQQVAPVYLTRFTPAGLDLQNAAKPGSTTNVSLTLDRKKQGGVKLGTAPKVKTMTAWASYDNGATWKKTTLKKSGSKWVATVKNPKSGYVTLRAKVTDTKGNSSDITIYRAYKIA
ncbi:hypothetical protein ACK8GE_21130 [Micromonosporaceae bacterium DT194]|uniref:hypothetical protein n=1 Tax=Melissospora conviva TaxID=3388432 RepID=UPI003C26E6DD